MYIHPVYDDDLAMKSHSTNFDDLVTEQKSSAFLKFKKRKVSENVLDFLEEM